MPEREDVCKNCLFGICGPTITDACTQGFDLVYDDISVTGCPEFEMRLVE